MANLFWNSVKQIYQFISKRVKHSYLGWVAGYMYMYTVLYIRQLNSIIYVKHGRDSQSGL